jgi:hypothetical protein
MAETIDAIQERVRPRRLIMDATERVKEATLGRVRDLAGSANRRWPDRSADSFVQAQTVVDSFKSNLLPAAVLAVAAATIFVRILARPRVDPSAHAWAVAERQRTRRHRNSARTARENATLLAAAVAGAACCAIWNTERPGNASSMDAQLPLTGDFNR